MSNSKRNRSAVMTVRTMAVAAMLTAMSVVIGIFCKTVLNFGNGLLRITFENLPILLSGLLFGPLVGGMVGACSDLVSYLLSAQSYPPNLIVTVGAALVGVIAGTGSRLLRRKKRGLRIILSCSLAHLIGSVMVKSIGLYQFYGMAVVWRIPVYLAVATLEITVLCLMMKRESFRELTDFERGDV